MRTYKEVLEDGIQLLETAAIEEARLDAWLLLEYTADITRAWYYAHMDDGLDAKTEERYRTLCTKRAQHIPLQHITGRAYFMGYEFCVDERVLVPRQDTEVLVEEAISRMRNLEKPQILDMCTGSGCIAIAIAKLGKPFIVHGVDISEEALAVARQNATELNASVELFAGDLMTRMDGQYDVIVSNPPYIPPSVIEGLMPEVRLHEPMLALDGGQDGLEFYRRIAGQAVTRLAPNGRLFLEIGCEQAAAVAEILQKQGYREVQVFQDLAGKDRIVQCIV